MQFIIVFDSNDFQGGIQRSAKVGARGLVKLVSALAQRAGIDFTKPCAPT